MRRIVLFVLCFILVDVQLTVASFVDNGDGTVTQDSYLMWQKSDDSQLRTYSQAENYCQTLSLAGYTDWRLPIYEELRSLVIIGGTPPTIDPVFNCHSYHYWCKDHTPNDDTVYGCFFGCVPNSCGGCWIDQLENIPPIYVRCIRKIPFPIGPSTIGVFRSGSWYLDINGNVKWDNCTFDGCYKFGVSTDTPVVGDWNGDGKTEIGVFRNGRWYLDTSGNNKWDGCSTDRCPYFGTTGDIPVAGDWNDDGTDEIGVFRKGIWYLDRNGNGVWDNCVTDRCYYFGTTGDKPIIGDWNGDMDAEMGVFRNGTWYLDTSGNNKWDGCNLNGPDECYYFGTTGDIPVAGYWNGYGMTDMGVKRGNKWYLDNNGNDAWDSCTTDGCYSFGLSTDKPVVGDWYVPTGPYMMDCPRVETDPFASSHANYQLTFSTDLNGRVITVIGVEISSVASGTAYVQLKDATTGDVLAMSGQKSTSALGWVEFSFNPGFTIDGRSLLVNFVTSTNARIYNCSGTVGFIPSGMTAYGMGLSDHMARSYIKIKK